MRKNSGLWAHLHALGILEKGSEEDIARAKRDYRKQYMRLYKQNQRKVKREYYVSLTRQEQIIVKREAQEHGLTEVQFFRKAVFAYVSESYIVPHISVLHEIQQLALRCQSDIERIANADKGGWLKPDRNYQNLENAIAVMREGASNAFANPPRLDQIIRKTLLDNPAFHQALKKILTEYDSEKHVS